MDELRVFIETGARLHFGFYMLMPVRRLWGGIGLAVDGLGYRLEVERVEQPVIHVEGCQKARLYNYVKEAIEKLRVDFGVRVKAYECIPEHRGFGSTTQAKLSIFHAIAKLAGLDVDVYRLAKLAGRGRVSGVGIGCFAYGGFIVDTGKRIGREDDIPKPMIRLEFPREWVAVYITPFASWRVPEEGEEVFQGAVGAERQYELFETVFAWLVPAIVDKDFDEFSEALEKLQLMMGEYFAKAQGGIFCCRESEVAARILKEVGGRGVGQSSWGPTVYAFFDNEDYARKALNKALDKLEAMGIRAEYYGILKPRNTGAKITVGE